jgi:hypothetical protein
LPGAESAAGAGQDNRAKRVVAGDAIEGGRELARHRSIEAIENVWTVQREQGHAVGGIKEDVVHALSRTLKEAISPVAWAEYGLSRHEY